MTMLSALTRPAVREITSLVGVLSNPAPFPQVLGTDNSRLATYSSTQDIPLPAGAQEGQPAIVALFVHGAHTAVVAPQGWQSLGHVTAGPNACMELFLGSMTSDQTDVTFSFEMRVIASGISLTLSHSEIGQPEILANQLGHRTTVPTVTLPKGGLNLVLLVGHGRNGTITSATPVQLLHRPNGSSFDKTAAVTWTSQPEDADTEAPAEIIFDHNYMYTGAMVLGLSPLSEQAELGLEFDIGAPL